MKYCVIKNTTKVIDGSKNPINTMVQNAQNSGFTENEIEILTEDEYLQRLKDEHEPPQQPSEQERIEALEQAMLEIIMGGM